MRPILHLGGCFALAFVGLAVTGEVGAQGDAEGLTRQRVEFSVENNSVPSERGVTRTIVGYRYDSSCHSQTAVLLMHGLSYTKEAWDFPGYSVAQQIAEAGYAVFAIDRLGYGESKLENGHHVTHEGYADMARQIVAQLRQQGFGRVVLGGHSAGAGTTELAAGLYGGVDVIMALGFHHRISDEVLPEAVTGDLARAAQDDYEYFLGTPERRAHFFYEPDADPAVVETDTRGAVLTPSGEILSIGKQPSRFVVGKIDVPVFLQFGERDRIFEVEYAQMHGEEFRSSPSVTVDIVPGAGHTFMLTKTGSAGTSRLVGWLRSRPEAPPCS